MTEETEVVLDTSSTLERLRGDEAFLQSLWEVFLDDLPNKLRVLERAVANGDMETALRSAHSLKGACATIGALAMRDTALAMELAARKEDENSVRAIHQRIPEMAAQVRLAIQEEHAHLGRDSAHQPKVS